MIIPQDITEEEAREIIDQTIKDLAGGNAQKEWKLRKLQNKIDNELAHFVDPVARMNKMVELFWIGVDEFREVLNEEVPVVRDYIDAIDNQQ